MKPSYLLTNLVKEIPKVQPRYRYLSEKSINPTYCDIEHCLPLCPHEKKIWALRGDLILAVGNKNAYVEKGNTNILDKVDPSVHDYIDLKDRYGHSSLALPEKQYDGSVYYAGWLYQHVDRIEVFIYTGRYHNLEISVLQQSYIECYIAMQFMEAFGTQDIVFFDWADNAEIDPYLRGELFSTSKQRRTYEPTLVDNLEKQWHQGAQKIQKTWRHHFFANKLSRNPAIEFSPLQHL